MERGFFGKYNMGLTHEEALVHAKRLKDQCREYGGAFTLLWYPCLRTPRFPC